MKKLIALNGSPRRTGTTAQLLTRALEGAEKAGAETELVNLYSLKFTGCLSCFYCKRKGIPHGHCALRDGLSPVLERMKTADAIVIGTPIYIFNISSATQGLLERFLFSNMLYSKENAVTLGRSIRVGLIYTMGMSEVLFERTGLRDKMKLMEQSLAMISGHPVKKLHSFEGIQFSDYSKYEADKLPEAQRRIYLAEQFPKDLEQAETMGRELVQA